jgi:hypothetical protein
MSVDVLIASLSRSRATNREDRAFDARFVLGRRARTTAGFAPAAMDGTPSIREECARSVSTGGRKPNAFRAASGHCTRIGITINEFRKKRPLRAAYRQSFFVRLFLRNRRSTGGLE